MRTLPKRIVSCLFLLIFFLCSACAEYQPTDGDRIETDLNVYFIDVGQADCVLITSPDGAMLIDGGNPQDAPEIISYIHQLGVTRLDVVVATHAHEDHVGGLSAVVDAFDVETIYSPVEEYSSDCFQKFIASANAKCGITLCRAGMEWLLGEAEITVLWPFEPVDTANTNNTSVVLRMVYGSVSFLFTGDLEHDAESQLAQSNAELSSTVLKVGHHGSSTSSSYIFLRRVLPEFAVISCGKGNSYGHPEEETLSRLEQAEAQIYRTDLNGTVMVSTDGTAITFHFDNTVFTASAAPETTPALESDNAYIGNIKTKKLHLSTCSALPAEDNRVYFAAREAAISQGYTPCSICKP